MVLDEFLEFSLQLAINLHEVFPSISKVAAECRVFSLELNEEIVSSYTDNISATWVPTQP